MVRIKIFTWTTKYQYLFDLTVSISFFYVVRFGVQFILDSKSGAEIKKLRWLKFLKMTNVDELIINYPINRETAFKFLSNVDLIIRIIRINMILLYSFVVLLHLRVIFVAYSTLSIQAFILSTLPNLISFYISFLASYQSVNCFFAIYVLTCNRTIIFFEF